MKTSPKSRGGRFPRLPRCLEPPVLLLGTLLACAATVHAHDEPDAAGACTGAFWVVLSEPAPAEAAPAEDAELRALQRRVARQQDEVMAQLTRLGGVELGRVHIVRNAVAVRLPAAAVEDARHLAGVVAVSPVHDIHRTGSSPAAAAPTCLPQAGPKAIDVR